MDEGRYGIVRKQEDQHRKFVCIINDILKTKTEVYESCLSREKYESSFRYVKNVMTVRRALVRQKVLQKCLEMRRRRTDGKKCLYGRYDGASLHSMSRDVEAYIASKHPKVRRLQKVQRLMKESVENGDILDPDAMNKKVEDFFRKRRDVLDNKSKEDDKRSNISKTLREPLISKLPRDHARSEHLKVVPSKVKVVDISNSRKDIINSEYDEGPDSCVEQDDVFVLKRRPTLILPPITTNRALVQGLEN